MRLSITNGPNISVKCYSIMLKDYESGNYSKISLYDPKTKLSGVTPPKLR